MKKWGPFMQKGSDSDFIDFDTFPEIVDTLAYPGFLKK